MEKNKKFQIVINAGLDEQTLDIVTRYWKFYGSEFNEKAGQVGADYDIHYANLAPIIKENSRAILYDTCSDCDKPLEFEVHSQTRFLQHYNRVHTCTACENAKEEALTKRKQENVRQVEQARRTRMTKAVENLAWNQLSFKENQVLFGILGKKHGNIDFKDLQHLSNGEKQMLIDKFQSLGLMDIRWIEDSAEHTFIFHPELPKKLNNYLKSFERKSKGHYSQSWSRLSFEVKKNPYNRKTGNSMFRGTMTFKEDFVIKAGTKCAYAVYSREDGNGWFSLTPVADVLLAENRTFEEEPLHISSVLDRIFEDKP